MSPLMSDPPCNSDPMDQSDFSGLGDSMANFVVSKTGLVVGPITHPPPVSTKKIAFLILKLLISSSFFIKRVLAGDTLFHDPKLYVALAVFVYFFSVLGTMHNIIRKMSMVLTDWSDPNKMIFFYQWSEMELGAEGFIVGFLYMVVGLLLTFVTHLLVWVNSVKVQRRFMLVALLVLYWAVSKVFYLDNWKTGYSIHAFWPASWL